MTTDSLQLDSTRLDMFLQDEQYDYDRELIGGSQNLLQWIISTITRWFNDLFDTVISEDAMTYILIGGGILLVVFLSWLYWRFRPRIFVNSDKEDALDYDMQEDTIYGIDFSKDIQRALSVGDYRQAMRLLYLQTLKYLEDTGQIHWLPSLTPDQYVRQVRQPAFTALSHHFIRVRYGNFQADAALFKEMQQLQSVIMKGGDA